MDTLLSIKVCSNLRFSLFDFFGGVRDFRNTDDLHTLLSLNTSQQELPILSLQIITLL